MVRSDRRPSPQPEATRAFHAREGKRVDLVQDFGRLPPHPATEAVEDAMVEANAAPVQESWEAFMRRVREAVGGCPAPGKHAARNAIRHVEQAFAVKDIDPEGAVFHAMTAEEEVATAIFHA